jgi:hypothetical protein
LKKGLAIGYWQPPEFERLDVLADRGLQAVAKLQRYLRSQQAQRNAERLPEAPERSERLERPERPERSETFMGEL